MLARLKCLSPALLALVSAYLVFVVAGPLPGQQRQPRASLKGHTGFAHSLAFIPDGKALASASDDTTIRLWDPANGKQAAAPQGHRSHVRVVAFSPDAKPLASTGDDRTVRLWDVASGKNTATLEGARPAGHLPGLQSGRQATGLGERGLQAGGDQAVGHAGCPGQGEVSKLVVGGVHSDPPER